ncbi:MAG: TIGR01777 family protein [Chitinophagaceae bacterium]|nr:TIGR01777 family protein [Chitinophagaceae bacterium]
MAVVLITGGTGLVGRALVKALLEKGYTCIVLTRGTPSGGGNLRYANWDPAKGLIEEKALAEADYIIHLAGAGVADKRWTAARKKEILDSRVQSGQLLLHKLAQVPNKVKAFISASAIGWYGPDPQLPHLRPFTETAPADDSFLGETCKSWEDSTAGLTGMHIRRVVLRIGIVLSREGGALGEFLKPIRFGLATVLGNGRQVVSWIHRTDLVNMMLYALENEKLNGVYNAVAPAPVSNRELILTLARERKKFYLPLKVPSFILRIMMGEMSIEVLKSATVSADKITAAGYAFLFPDIQSAVREELNQTR